MLAYFIVQKYEKVVTLYIYTILYYFSHNIQRLLFPKKTDGLPF